MPYLVKTGVHPLEGLYMVLAQAARSDRRGKSDGLTLVVSGRVKGLGSPRSRVTSNRVVGYSEVLLFVHQGGMFAYERGVDDSLHRDWARVVA
jgi:hypothetical protein